MSYAICDPTFRLTRCNVLPAYFAACGLLLVGGFAYNEYVGRHIEQGSGDFMARFVALGVGGTIIIESLALRNAHLTAWQWMALTLLAFGCSGMGMAWGSWQRRSR